jgi:C4-dicarboxylate-specific signal transduction histidine kinase
VNKNIISDIDRASEIVRNLSKLALNQGNEVSTVNVCDTVNEIVEISNSRLLASGIKCEVHCDPIHQVQINLGEWRQVLLNLVNNAIDALADFSSDEKKISIAIVRKGKTVQISIQDNGPGLGKGKETEIFDLLVSGKQGGTGIGLWISKNIINRGGGVISAMNLRGGGARFIIEFPAGE